jgi:hypothetical protein
VSGRRVHAVVAAGLADPLLLAKWADDAGALSELGIAAESLDISALRKFTGLTTIVRHNGLRHELPRTFRLLSAARIEIDLFADYVIHLARAGQGLAAGSAERASDLAAFIGEWIDPEDPAHLRVHDMVRHEAAILALGGEAAPAGQPSPGPAGTAGADSIPAVRGAIILHAFHGDPRSAGTEAASEPARLGYWRASAAEPLRIVDLDIFTFELLRRVDGAVSATRLAAMVTAGEPTARFLAALDEVAALGIITLGAP